MEGCCSTFHDINKLLKATLLMQNIRNIFFIIVLFTLLISCISNNGNKKDTSIPEKSSEVPIPKLETELPLTNYNQLDVLVLRKGIIKVGMVSDDFIEIVSTKEIVNQIVETDPINQNSLVVRKDCKVENIEFSVILARNPDPGPYRIISILTRKNTIETPTTRHKKEEPSSSSLTSKIETIEDFKISEFYKYYKLYSNDGWELKEGGYNNVFETASIPDVSFEVVTIVNKVSEFGIIFYERGILQDIELNFVYKLLESLDKKKEVDSRIKEYIRTKAEKNISQIKQANPITFGKYRVYAGKVGSDQTIHVEKF